MNPKIIAEQLIALGLSQSDVWKRAGVSQSTVSHILSGKRGKRTSFEVVQRLHALLVEVQQEKGVAGHA
ncbi:helix-turn-helix domain-containing protein [Achromobacter xylosoxidans]|uniref:helix-turn-helix domain-containing protein n=1 Tax=Alcaligenes xylosoxydans xylosoxydans TaxID=85698 RepID=UPI00047A53E4|nr:helix-turn-helix transcriptional regulator [Achromobacter xylosoxidans]QQV12930.1 helix-turn-helix transcriptional regulator [Achromobacter xylosoxidans]